MDKFKGPARRALARIGLLQTGEELLPGGKQYSALGRGQDGERLLASPAPSARDSENISQSCCDCECHHPSEEVSSRKRSLARKTNLFASAFWLLGAVVILVAFTWDKGSTPARGQIGWSPAAHVVEYSEQLFPYYDIDPGQDKYNGPPSHQLDQDWFDLYNWLARVPTAEAKAMHNHTVEIPGDPGHSLVWLGVFHELHCLNLFRKLAWFEYYDILGNLLSGKDNTRGHLVHCIDALRKGTMCHSDVTPIPFWQEPYLKDNQITPIFKTIHTCRNYEAIRDWAKENKVDKVECEDEFSCGVLNALTMTIPNEDPQPTNWPDPHWSTDRIPDPPRPTNWQRPPS